MAHSRFHLPRRTVRLRLTALYGTLFLVSGALLLAITYGVVSGHQINMSFGVERSGLALKAVPVGAQRLVNFSSCMQAHGITGYPVPRIADGGRSLHIVGSGRVKSSPQLEAAAAVCQKATGVPAAMVLPPAAGDLSATVAGSPPLAFVEQLPTPQEKADWLVVSGVALAIMALASVGLGWVMAGRALRPVRDMTAAARHISEDNLHSRLAIKGPDDELKDLAETFDGMLGRLEGSFESQRRFVANASHELRTPLAMMRTSLDVALGKPGPPRELTVLAAKLEEGLDQAEKLLDNLLVLARSQRGALGPPEPVSLRALARTALEAQGPEVERLGLTVESTVLGGTTSGAQVMGNPVLLERMVANVVGNAVRHNVPGGTVRVSGGGQGKWARLVVENTGPVIGPDRLAQLGEPFARPGSERMANGDGSGLGLSIAKAVAAAHGGTFILHARPGGGLQVAIELPVRAAP